VRNHRKITLMLGAGICFAVQGIVFAQAGSGAPAGGAGQSGAGQSGAGQSGAGTMPGRAGSDRQTGTADRDTTAGSSGHSMSADQKFAQNAAAGGLAEVQLGQLAADKATNDKVKQFGQRMVTDHTKANNELKALAAKKSITLPDSPKPKDKATFEKLSKMSGPAFDKAYMQDMVKDHQKDVAEFQKEASNGSDPDLKAWAATTLPVLQEHLKLAKDTLSAVNSSGGGASGGSSDSSGGK
jgi:putative membrane protein